MLSARNPFKLGINDFTQDSFQDEISRPTFIATTMPWADDATVRPLSAFATKMLAKM
jgi:hypothetical protein